MWSSPTASHRTRSVLAALITTPLAAAALVLSPAAGVAEPSATALDEPVSETIVLTEDFDGGGTRYYGEGDLGDGGQGEGGDPLFELEDGVTLSNVVLGSPAADGVHCEGSCTLRNVVWEDVGEDAATFRADSASAQFRVEGGSAAAAEDKVFQHNGPGTLTVTGFTVEDFGALYRSCGNCSSMYERHVVLDDITVNTPGDRLVGINENYGDTATLSNITIIGDDDRDITICQRYEGNDDGDEPDETGEGPDGTHCLYEESDITYQ
ncbi:pectate lyase [Actinoalloteichus fjordicus]|uniref:Pectate lyase n=1 Tax=Actinoalloteichus fjordicus TaxID=1612552 RepID=A0AAC9LFM5_9PSEU|nr:pectate lyase [Actinoalloteichus fjordicus]APU16801.1 Pectate lyase [Actinoalloteichus fjordicus]